MSGLNTTVKLGKLTLTVKSATSEVNFGGCSCESITEN